MDQPIGWFSSSPSIVLQVSLATGRLTNYPTLHLYIGHVYRVIQPVRRENDFASKVPKRESNSSYTAAVDPVPSALSPRPTLLPHKLQKWNKFSAIRMKVWGIFSKVFFFLP